MADKFKLGYEFPVRVIDVEKGKIAEFVMAVAQRDTPDKINPLYTDEETAKKAGYRLSLPGRETESKYCFAPLTGIAAFVRRQISIDEFLSSS